MRLRRFELPRDYLPLGPQPSASANSATAACSLGYELQMRNYEGKTALVNSGCLTNKTRCKNDFEATGYLIVWPPRI